MIRLVLALMLASVAVASLVLYIVRVSLGVTAGFDGSALLCVLGLGGALWLMFCREPSS